MKKVVAIIFTIILFVSLSTITVCAKDNTMIYDTQGIYDSLSDEVKQSLNDMGVNDYSASTLSNLDFNSVVKEITNMAGKNVSTVLKGFVTTLAILLLSALLSIYKGTLNSDVANTLNITTALCMTSALVLPTIDVINSTQSVITSASNIMLAFIPVMAVIMASSGKAASGSSYYVMMIAAGEGVGQLSSKVIVPLLDMFLGMSITGSVSKDVNLGGFTSLVSKTIKWILGFAMTIFTAVLSIRQLITTSLDNVSTRAVRFTLNSFIPIVGSALSDAYKTVQSSVGLLKTGVGVFVIIAVAVVFLPIIIKCFMWIITLWIVKSVAEVFNMAQSAKLIEALCTVFSTLLSILLCIMSVYIISSAIVLIIGGGGV